MKVLPVVLLGLGACATPNPRRTVSAPEPVADPVAAAAVATPPEKTEPEKPATEKPAPAATTVEPIVAVVAGRPVYVSELLTQWVYARNHEVLKQLDNLALGRIVEAEAQRLQVRVEPAFTTAAYERTVAEMEAEIKKKNPKLGFDSYVDRVMGLDPIRYRQQLRDVALRQQLGERVARAWLLSAERSDVRLIVAKDDTQAAVVKAGLAAGKDFADLARLHSADASSADGGRIPPVVRSDSPIGRLAFSGEVGKVVGPLTEAGRQLWMLVESRPVPLTGAWPELAAAVEADLAQRPVDELEMAQWRSAMQLRYEVDFQPFLRLVGQEGR